MRTSGIARAVLAGAVCISLALSGAVLAQVDHPLSDEEKKLEHVENNVLTLQRKLSAARKRGDADEVKRLQKRFDKSQKKRLGILRDTWQM